MCISQGQRNSFKLKLHAKSWFHGTICSFFTETVLTPKQTDKIFFKWVLKRKKEKKNMTLKSMRQGWEVGIMQGTYAEGVLPPWLKWGHVGHESKGDPIRSHSYPALSLDQLVLPVLQNQPIIKWSFSTMVPYVLFRSTSHASKLHGFRGSPMQPHTFLCRASTVSLTSAFEESN